MNQYKKLLFEEPSTLFSFQRVDISFSEITEDFFSLLVQADQ